MTNSKDQKDSFKIIDTSLSDKATEIIRKMIIKGEYPLGSRITEAQFAEMLGVSRACIRETFITLEKEGLINRVTNKYTEICDYTGNDIMDIYRLRTAIEVMCLDICLEKGTVPINDLLVQADKIAKDYSDNNDTSDMIDWIYDDLSFHEIIVKASENSRALSVFDRLKNQIKCILYTSARIKPQDFSPVDYSSDSSHMGIINYLKNSDGEGAKKALANHIMSGVDKIIEIHVSIKY